MSTPRCAGRLLVALPLLEDPNFARTVVLVLEHDGDGALGLVLNRPSDTAVHDVLEAGWDAILTRPATLFGGGPVEPGAVVGLGVARATAGPPRSGRRDLRIGTGIRTVDPTADPADVAREVSGARIFAGYAGWAPDQLDDEVQSGAWIVVDATPDDVLCTDPDALWADVLGRQPGNLRLLRTFPDDPRLN